MIELSDFIMNEFKIILNNQDWIDEKSKKIVFDKVKIENFSIYYLL
jgi:hypothetical protein